MARDYYGLCSLFHIRASRFRGSSDFFFFVSIYDLRSIVVGRGNGGCELEVVMRLLLELLLLVVRV